MLVEDTLNPLPLEQLPQKRFWIDKEFYRGSPAGLILNARILNKIQELRTENSYRLVKPDDVCDKIINFLKPHFTQGVSFTNLITVAGFNFSNSGRKFLSKLKGFDSLPFDTRSIEVHTQFIDWFDANPICNFAQCKERAGIEGGVQRDTLICAWDVIQILRTKYVPKVESIKLRKYKPKGNVSRTFNNVDS
jgi:hypothetical protein